MENSPRKSGRFWGQKTISMCLQRNNRGGRQSEEKSRKRCWLGTTSLVTEDTERQVDREIWTEYLDL